MEYIPCPQACVFTRTHTYTQIYLSICSINICHAALIINFKTLHQCNNDSSGEKKHTAVNEPLNYKAHSNFRNTGMCM